MRLTTSDEAQNAQTAGVILRELIAFADQGADAFFGLPEIVTSDFLETITHTVRISRQKVPRSTARKSTRMSPIDRAVGEVSRTLARGLIKNIFKRR